MNRSHETPANLAPYCKAVSGDCNKIWWTSGCGRIELQFTRADLDTYPRHGQQDIQVKALSLQPHIRRQTDLIDADVLFKELREYGVWSDLELRNHADNLQRILWIAVNDVKEEN